MPLLPRCVLLPVDGTDEALRPIHFLSSLFPNRESLSILLGYFAPSLPPVFGEGVAQPWLRKKRHEAELTRRSGIRAVFDHARQVLLSAGFPGETIQEHVQDRAMSVARQTCVLAEMRRVDAVVVSKRTSSALEGFLKGDQTSALLNHCLNSPVWFIEGQPGVDLAAIYLPGDDTALRAVDHAAFMLEATQTRIALILPGRKIGRPITIGLPETIPAEASNWLTTDEGRRTGAILKQACAMLIDGGIDPTRVRITFLPSRGDESSELIAFCRHAAADIVVLSDRDTEKGWRFLRTSLSRRLMSELHDMALWVIPS